MKPSNPVITLKQRFTFFFPLVLKPSSGEDDEECKLNHKPTEMKPLVRSRHLS